MKNEGETMKRFVCVFLILCLLPVCAFAVDLDEFNIFASVIGAPELDSATAQNVNGYSRFIQGDCSIIFSEKDGKSNIFVQGSGDEFLAYCCAAIHVFDLNGNTTSNHGQLLTMYFLAHTETEHQTGQTSNGYFFFIEPREAGYMFMIGD